MQSGHGLQLIIKTWVTLASWALSHPQLPWGEARRVYGYRTRFSRCHNWLHSYLLVCQCLAEEEEFATWLEASFVAYSPGLESCRELVGTDILHCPGRDTVDVRRPFVPQRLMRTAGIVLLKPAFQSPGLFLPGSLPDSPESLWLCPHAYARGLSLDLDLARRALDDLELWSETLGPDTAQWLLAVAQKARTSAPALFASLQQAARDGTLLHEAMIQYPSPTGGWVNGRIDLLWKDSQGWHMLDYKTGKSVAVKTSDKDPMQHETLRKYYSQVRLYQQGLVDLLGPEELVDFGLWFVEAGVVVRWSA